jgi:hypothetical protein
MLKVNQMLKTKRAKNHPQLNIRSTNEIQKK